MFWRNSSSQFDFKRVVANARRDYPEETAQTTFIDFDKRNAEKQVEKWFEKVYKAAGKSKAEIAASKPEVRSSIVEMFIYMGWGFTLPSTDGNFIVAGISAKAALKDGSPGDAHYNFNHELGHVVDPKLLIKRPSLAEKQKSELRADRFAVMRGLHQGTLKEADILQVIRTRATGDTEHCTAPGLRKLAGKLRGVDPASLTPQEVKRRAALCGGP